MILHHATTQEFAEHIKSDGIVPRKGTKGNWWTNVPGNSELVYFNNHYISNEFHMARACIANNTLNGAVVYVDTDKLDEKNLRVDENFLDFERRGTYINGDIEERIGDRELALSDTRWEESVKKVGNCSYFGTVPKEAVVDIKFYYNGYGPQGNQQNRFYWDSYEKFETVEEKLLAFDFLLKANKSFDDPAKINMDQFKDFSHREALVNKYI